MSLKTLKEKVDSLETKKEARAEHEKQIYLINREIRSLEREQIPFLMLEEGITNCILNDGRQVLIKPDVSVSIKDKEKFHSFLEKQDSAQHIKTVVKFDKMSTEKRRKLLRFLMDGEYGSSQEDAVHYQTARKYFKDLLEREPKLEKVIELFASVSHFWHTRITHTE